MVTQREFDGRGRTGRVVATHWRVRCGQAHDKIWREDEIRVYCSSLSWFRDHSTTKVSFRLFQTYARVRWVHEPGNEASKRAMSHVSWKWRMTKISFSVLFASSAELSPERSPVQLPGVCILCLPILYRENWMVEDANCLYYSLHRETQRSSAGDARMPVLPK